MGALRWQVIHQWAKESRNWGRPVWLTRVMSSVGWDAAGLAFASGAGAAVGVALAVPQAASSPTTAINNKRKIVCNQFSPRS